MSPGRRRHLRHLIQDHLIEIAAAQSIEIVCTVELNPRLLLPEIYPQLRLIDRAPGDALGHGLEQVPGDCLGLVAEGGNVAQPGVGAGRLHGRHDQSLHTGDRLAGTSVADRNDVPRPVLLEQGHERRSDLNIKLQARHAV